MSQFSEWNVRLTGNGDSQKDIDFVDKVETQVRCYQINDPIVCLFQEKRDSWFRYNREEWNN